MAALPRLKLPPFSRDLIRMRDAGNHPERVYVLIGRDWGRRHPTYPTLCVPDGDIELYDYSILRGLPVYVVDRGGDALQLAAMIAAHTAPVFLCWRATEEDLFVSPGAPLVEDIGHLYFQADYWPAERRAEYEARRRRWWLAALFELASQFLEPQELAA